MLKYVDDISTQAGEFSDVLAWSDYKNFVHEVNNEALLDSTAPWPCDVPRMRQSF